MPRNSRFVVAFTTVVLIAVAGIVLATQLGHDGGDDAAVATAPASVPTTAQSTPTSPETGAVAGRDAPSSDGRLAAGDVELLPVPAAGLSDLDGRRARGSRLVVVRVADGGFHVGRRAGDSETVLVEHKSSYAPQEGDRVDLEGDIRRSADAQHGGVIDARSVVPEGTGGGADGDADAGNAEDHRP